MSPDQAAEIDARAAEIERDRKEQIRQSEEEIAEMLELHGSFEEWLSWVEDGPLSDGPWVADGHVVAYVQRNARRSRIIAGLESKLADLKRGMK